MTWTGYNDDENRRPYREPMPEEEVVERVAIALHTADSAQITLPLSWSSTSDYARAEFRKLAKAAIAEHTRILEEGKWTTVGYHVNGGEIEHNSGTGATRMKYE